MTQAIVGKWGNNLAVRLPGEIVRLAEPRIGLNDLFRGKTPQAWREAYAGARDEADDWGPNVGREVVAE
jgi:hypothetical protein